jgi:hypothetical protein
MIEVDPDYYAQPSQLPVGYRRSLLPLAGSSSARTILTPSAHTGSVCQ